MLIFLFGFGGILLCLKIIQTAPGLPIDDAYIFKRYALNLAQGYGFSFNPGEPSSGCSSVLWAWFMAGVVKLFGEENYNFLAQFFGSLFTALGIWFMLQLIKRETRSWVLIILAGFFAWFSPHIYMNAISGMESGLFLFLVFANFFWLKKSEGRKGWLWGGISGLISALTYIARPEGLYFISGFGLIYLYLALRGERKYFQNFFGLILGAVVLLVPYFLWMESQFAQLLPYTYLGKIYSCNPAILRRGLGERIMAGWVFLFLGWSLLFGMWKLAGWGIFAFSFLGAGYSLVRFFSRFSFAGMILAGGWLLVPFVYGFNFPVAPHFGGYYQRYIASVWLVGVFLAVWFLQQVGEWIFKKIRLSFKTKEAVYSLGLVLVVIYSFPIVRFQLKEGKRIYLREVKMNEGIRKQSALWIRENTPESARVLVGYTGLGVVGLECGRYVYDLGALINPDILPYLEGTLPLSQARWENLLKYICKNKIDYFVTFAVPGFSRPEDTPGFYEVARIGRQGEPETNYEQIRIYRIEPNELCFGKKEKKGERK